MTLMTVTWVAPDISSWEDKQRGKTTHYVNVSFADGTSGSVGKQNEAKAKELHGLLTELIGKEVEFGLEDTGKKTNKGALKWKIKSFPGYEPEPYHGGGERAPRDEAGMAIGAAGHDAAVITAALVSPGTSADVALIIYNVLVADIYANNQNLRTAGKDRPEEPTATATTRGHATASSTSSGQEGVSGSSQGEAVAAPSCSHEHPTFKLPNGRPVKDGQFYCPDCRRVVRG